ncbi:ABC transporter substrate-binding protein [Vibrio ulleungensis]|uniref:Carbohydrate ABC transporter substrate-binding protein n=1 Tax=Vibrio ulleungensis TaxID=2807619 RepID=A0ABS2HCT6_9VIBR|nr:ABC transporter substrate-binding protein [Vibrio ulleungensis]MBM7035388.1 carbohydrate ABC transporter substrate-binding protein [Vibrio ulleungensis]
MKLQKLTLCTAIAAAIMASTSVAAKTELEVASWKGAGAEVADFPAIIERFEQKYPDIEVKLSYMARNDMVTSIPARMQAGNPPDVVMVDREFILHWGGNGQLKTLNDLPFVERVQPNLRPYLGLGDDIYYSMLEVSGMGVYTNDDLLAKAGVDSYPQTIEELVSACGKLNDAGIQPMLLAANNGGWTPFVYFLAMGLADSDNPDHTRIDKLISGEQSFENDESMKMAFEGFRKMIDAKCFDPKISAGTDPWSVALTTFQSGRVAMLPQGMWNITPFMNDSLPENFSFHPFSAINGDTGITMDYNGPGWSIPVAAKDVDAAEKWIDFWMTDENLQIFLRADTAISTLVDGTSGVPAVADPFKAARNAGHMVTFPVGTIPPQLGIDMPNDITSFMLDPTQDYNEILKGWDKVAAKERK